MHLVDLRQLNAYQLAALLNEEALLWQDELHWDYRFSLELIKKFLETHSLAGTAAIEDGRAAGYGFYVIEDHKGMLGGLFVSPRNVRRVPLVSGSWAILSKRFEAHLKYNALKRSSCLSAHRLSACWRLTGSGYFHANSCFSNWGTPHRPHQPRHPACASNAGRNAIWPVARS